MRCQHLLMRASLRWWLWAAPPESSSGGKPGLGAVAGQGRLRGSVHLGGNKGPCEGLSTVEQAGSPALQNISEHSNPRQPGPGSQRCQQLVARRYKQPQTTTQHLPMGNAPHCPGLLRRPAPGDRSEHSGPTRSHRVIALSSQQKACLEAGVSLVLKGTARWLSTRGADAEQETRARRARSSCIRSSLHAVGGPLGPPEPEQTSLAHKACDTHSATQAGGTLPGPSPTTHHPRPGGKGPPPGPSPPRLGDTSVVSRQLNSINGPLQTKQDHCGARGGQGQPPQPQQGGRTALTLQLGDVFQLHVQPWERQRQQTQSASFLWTSYVSAQGPVRRVGHRRKEALVLTAGRELEAAV